jgi:hypothetical protein
MAGLEQFRKTVKRMGSSPDFELISQFGKLHKEQQEQREKEVSFSSKYEVCRQQSLPVEQFEQDIQAVLRDLDRLGLARLPSEPL